MRKWMRNVKNEKCKQGILRHFFRFSHFAPGLVFAQKFKEFRGLFFRNINKTRNLLEMQNVYSVSYSLVFRKNIRKIPAKCEM